MIKFLKENKVAVISIAAFVVVAILLAIPGYAHFGIVGDSYTYKINGYQFFFNSAENVLGNALGASIVGGGITIIVLAVVAIALVCLWKLSSFFVLLAAIVNVSIAGLFYGMENFAVKAYPAFMTFDGKYFVSWPNYVAASIILVVGVYLGYVAIKMMINEVKHPAAPKGPKYNYLKK